jgi:thiamine pyrophosphate-dependent acetolactate synthase large subunit-like protein
MGMNAIRVTEPDTLPDVLKQSNRRNGPTLIDVVVDGTV